MDSRRASSTTSRGRRPTPSPACRRRAQPDRHDDVVRHHGRQRDAPRRSPSRWPRRSRRGRHSMASPLLLLGQRQGQHEEVGVRARGHHGEPDHGDRHHEEAHQRRGRAERPRRRWRGARSSAFSTTSTWNIRGRQRKAAAERKVSPAQRPGTISPAGDGRGVDAARGCRAGPPATPQTTKTPDRQQRHAA